MKRQRLESARNKRESFIAIEVSVSMAISRSSGSPLVGKKYVDPLGGKVFPVQFEGNRRNSTNMIFILVHEKFLVVFGLEYFFFLIID